MKLKFNTVALVALFCLCSLTLYIAFSAFNSKTTDKPDLEAFVKPEELITEPSIRFNLRADSFHVSTEIIKKNEFLSTILERYNISPLTVSTIAKKSKPIFDVRKMSVGKNYTLFSNKENPSQLAYFIYQLNPIDYIVYDLRDSVHVYAGKKKVYKKVETIMGTINSSLYEALQESGSSPDIAIPLSEIFGGVVNFYAIQKGDWFKIQYERHYVNDELIGHGKIQSAVFSHKEKEFEAHYFQSDSNSKGNYYDENGNSLRRAFLKAPLKYSRISSRFSGKRLHPVQKIWKAHLGTDYAAPHGTPIVATADGVVIESKLGRGNGNYVKVKHNKTYTTQYLHMSKRAVKRGQRVSQGQVIGYVGSTGLATGPHVCYRFWENGKQVDALRKNFKSSEPINGKYKQAFAELVRIKQLQLANAKAPIPIDEIIEYTAYQDGPPDLFKYFGKL